MWRIFIACGLTVLIEGLFFILLGYREKWFVLLCVCANVLTNLTLNLLVWLLYYLGVKLTVVVYPLEALVVVSEYLIYRAYEGASKKLFLMVFAANALSYLTGVLLFGHV